MILAPTLTLNALRGPSVDPDVAAYVATSGATDVAALSAFVKGVKDLGLWSNMVCWPLRSTQNAGTGTTAFSLGGLGTFNGTLVNGPTWGVDGITFPRTAATHISATRPIGSAAADAYSIFSVHTQLVEDANFRALWLGRDASNDRMFVRTTGDTFGASNVSAVSAPTDIDGTHSTALTAGAGDTGKAVAAYKDGANTGSATGNATGTNSVYYIGGLAGDATRSFGFPIAFNGAFNLELSSAQVAAVHNLYKTTLGTGLGLP
jgi:hypothetical protein